MIPVIFPEPDFRTREENGKRYIFDPLRKRWLLLTPEEWVRRNFINYLVKSLGYPETLIAQEKKIRLGELNKRFDILVYDREHKPWMMVECKEMNVPLSGETLQQILRYNISVPVTYLIITNGSQTAGWKRTSSGLEELLSLPAHP